MGGDLTPGTWVRELDVDGSVTLFHTGTQTALVLNATASDVWRLLDGKRQVDEIVSVLSDTYSADTDALRAGVEDALTQLREHDLLGPLGTAH